MPNKSIPPSKRSKGAGISLPPDVIKTARRHAYKRGMSLSGLVRQLLIKELKEAGE